MTKTDTASVFAEITPTPMDPVLASIEAFAADPRPDKVNLGVGMYYDESGKIPRLRVVHDAEELIARNPAPYGYLPVEGTAAFRSGVETLLFGVGHAAVADGRVATFQALGGTGALRVGAEILRLLKTSGILALSGPTWPNHPVLFGAAGFEIATYPYVDPATGGLMFDRMLAALAALRPGTVVLLQTCCHNPTGVDLDRDQWLRLADVLRARSLIPFLDLAYQGFADGIDEDAWPVRMFAESGLPLFVALSFSKSFALYGERVGALCVVTASPRETGLVSGRAKNIIRAIYSTPPTHGAAIVSTVLNSPELGELWRTELGEMRDRIKQMRLGLVEALKAKGLNADFSFMQRQRGLFSYSGLSAAQIEQMTRGHAIHAVRDGRLCMAALNHHNLSRVADAIVQVVLHAP